MLLGTLSKEKLRWITLIFFFLSGIITASWASRIPDVQNKFSLNDAQWGLILFALPLGLVIGLPISSWIVAKYSARKTMVISSIFFAFIFNLIDLLHCLRDKYILYKLLHLYEHAFTFSDVNDH